VSRPPTLSAIHPHTRLSIHSLHQPTSKSTKRVRSNLFRVSVTFSSPTDTRKLKAADTLSHTPSYMTFHRFLCQPTSKCMKQVRLNSFHVSVTISGRMDTRSPKAADTLSHTPSYLASHPFPVSSHLQMRKTSSFELISCFGDLFQPYRYTKIQGS